MWLWALSFIFMFYSLQLILLDGGTWNWLSSAWGIRKEILILQKVIYLLHETQEILEAGMVPDADHWSEIRTLPDPWGGLIFSSLQELRAQGGSLLPTLKRFRSLAQEQQDTLKDARAKSGQALAQALICSFLVPVLGLILYKIMPGLDHSPWTWISACTLGFLLSAAAGIWLMKIAEEARWGGLAKSERAWVLSVLCAGERFLALVRSGVPPDLAWVQVCDFLQKNAPEVLVRWGCSLWENIPESQFQKKRLAQALLSLGSSMKKGIQVSLMEGRPCLERVETILYSLRQEIRSAIQHELSVLGVRVLKPLFLCVAPALLGLLATALFLGWCEMSGGGNGVF